VRWCELEPKSFRVRGLLWVLEDELIRGFWEDGETENMRTVRLDLSKCIPPCLRLVLL
jgi:hypothetical protein